MILYQRAWKDDPRKCSRCGADIHAPDPEHVCKDIRERHERQRKAVEVIEAILDRYYIESGQDPEPVALDIIRALSGRDLGVG